MDLIGKTAVSSALLGLCLTVGLAKADEFEQAPQDNIHEIVQQEAHALIPVLDSEETERYNAIDQAIATNRAGFLETESGRLYLKEFDRFRGVNQRLKYTRLKDGLTIVRETVIGFGSFTQYDHKLNKGRESIIGENIAKVLRALRITPNRQRSDNPLAKMYDENVPMIWTVKNVGQLRQLLGYLKQGLADIPNPKTTRSILVFRLLDDDAQTTVTEQDRAELNKYFFCCTYEEEELAEYFTRCLDHMLEYNAKTAKGEYVNETVPEAVLRQFDKATEDLEFRKAAPYFITTVAGLIVFRGIWSEIEALAKDTGVTPGRLLAGYISQYSGMIWKLLANRGTSN